MSFIIIETFGGPEFAIVVTDQDGINLVFDTRQEAEEEKGNCQDAIVVEI
ncbi:hypothetical protein [Mucilaginibacter dorajii]|uniref:Uncharacterized protein n=1 Tax=Mucilaginibacter dorajii TaxID=692994 RepID=A0ABP7Q527_9SPHI|nr:hypothetical protein [Mucilaginibacter dorajii]MCS3732552.1 hypothetical protein [Mucilaginibacter dorajii]